MYESNKINSKKINESQRKKIKSDSSFLIYFASILFLKICVSFIFNKNYLLFFLSFITKVFHNFFIVVYFRMRKKNRK